MRRSGQFLKFLGIGVFIVSIFMIASFIYITYIGDLSRTTVIKSQAAYDRLGVTEEVMHASCATDARGVFRLSAIRDGNLSCITSDRTVGLRFTMTIGGSTETHAYSVHDGTVETLAADASLRSGEEDIRDVPIVVQGNQGRYRGIVSMAVAGTGWQCRQLPGRCVDEGTACLRPADADCGAGRICCRITVGGPGAP